MTNPLNLLVTEFIKNVEAGNCPPKVDFEAVELEDEDIQAIADTLSSGLLPDDITINLSDTDLNDEKMSFLANSCRSGKWPRRLTLDLGGNDEIESEGFGSMMSALGDGYGPEGLTLDFTGSSIDTIQDLKMNLEKNLFPKNCTIILCSCEFNNEDEIKSLAEAMPHYPSGFSLFLDDNHLSAPVLESFAAAIEKNNSAREIRIILQLPDDDKYQPEDESKDNNDKTRQAAVHRIAEAMKENTSIIELGLTSGSQEDRNVIQDCCERNRKAWEEHLLSTTTSPAGPSSKKIESVEENPVKKSVKRPADDSEEGETRATKKTGFSSDFFPTAAQHSSGGGTSSSRVMSEDENNEIHKKMMDLLKLYKNAVDKLQDAMEKQDYEALRQVMDLLKLYKNAVDKLQDAMEKQDYEALRQLISQEPQKEEHIPVMK